MKAAAMELRSQTANPPVILLVEDESMVRAVTREVLLHAGYRVLESGNAREALHVAQMHAGEIDLLLTDVIMPEMNGAELANQLQNLKPKLVTVFMSGYAQSDVARKIRRTSAIHIQKPFTVQLLLSRVAEALRAKAPEPDSVAIANDQNAMPTEYGARAGQEAVPNRAS